MNGIMPSDEEPSRSVRNRSWVLVLIVLTPSSSTVIKRQEVAFDVHVIQPGRRVYSSVARHILLGENKTHCLFCQHFQNGFMSVERVPIVSFESLSQNYW
jgi:hypothetical protein